jgi:hypothetical protein
MEVAARMEGAPNIRYFFLPNKDLSRYPEYPGRDSNIGLYVDSRRAA